MADPKDPRKRSIERLYTTWHKRAIGKIANLLDNEAFASDINQAKTRCSSEDDYLHAALGIIRTYKLPLSALEPLAFYIATDELNHFYMRYPVIVVSTKENIAAPSLTLNDGRKLKAELDKAMEKNPNRWVYLLLDPECTQTDLREFVRDWWSVLIQPRLKKIKPTGIKRVATSSFVKRDQAIYKHIKQLGKPATEIAAKYGITPEYARIIANREDKKRNK